jgi:hypothetical protein
MINYKTPKQARKKSKNVNINNQKQKFDKFYLTDLNHISRYL